MWKAASYLDMLEACIDSVWETIKQSNTEMDHKDWYRLELIFHIRSSEAIKVPMRCNGSEIKEYMVKNHRP